MLIATLTTDYGLDDHYVASLKGALYYACSNLLVVDINHQIPPFDIKTCAHIMKNGTSSYPPGTIHITTVSLNESNNKFILVEKNEQFFICPDNGIICLIFPDQQFNAYFIDTITKDSSYKEINIELGNICKRLSNGEEPQAIGNYTTSYNVKSLPNPVRRDNLMIGNVFYIDSFGNVLVNISKELFESFVPPYHRYSIDFKKYRVNKISNNYNSVKEGDLLVLFNEEGWLEISIKNGRASSLIGLNISDTIIVEIFK